MEGKLIHLVHEGCMAYRVKGLRKIQSYDVQKGIGRKHVTYSVEQSNERRSCRAGGPEGVLVGKKQ